AAGGVLGESELTRLPFEWDGVSLCAVGATRLRARITLVGEDTISITLADSCGGVVGSVDSLALRGVSPAQLRISAAADDAMYGLDWVALTTSNAGTDGVVADNVTVLRCPTTTADGAALPAGTRQVLAHVLDRVQDWLSDDRRDVNARLVVLTRGAITV